MVSTARRAAGHGGGLHGPEVGPAVFVGDGPGQVRGPPLAGVGVGHDDDAVAARSDYLPSDSGVLRQNAVDQPAKLLSTFEPPSNEFAQSTGVAGMALYHAVIGPDGKPGEIVVARPIGFGLDENAVDAIRKASFEPAVKDGKPVPVVLDLVVQFRIYSKRTAVAAKDLPKETPAGPLLPGPYTLAAEPMSGSGSGK